MNTITNTQSATYSLQHFRRKEKDIFQKIPGMVELVHADPDSIDTVKTKYPDAAFAMMVSDNLFSHDREQSEIYQRAYFSILNGESMANVRFRYEEDTKKYLSRHLWDD